MLQKEILSLFRAARVKAGNWTLWADQALLESEKWQCWEERGRLKASVGICGRRGGDEVAALSVQAPWQRVHAHSPATLIRLSIRHSQSGDREWNHLFAQKKKARPSCVGERWGENKHEGHFCLLSKLVLEISFSSSFRSLAELGWQRPSAPLACSLKNKEKSHCFHNMAKSQWWTGTGYWRWRCSTAAGISWLLEEVQTVCHKLKSAYREAAAAWWK